MQIVIRQLIVCLITFSLGISYVNACTRTIYNNSNSTWKFASAYGAVTVSDATCINETCTLPPKQAFAIHYRKDFHNSVTIIDKNNNSKSFNYFDVLMQPCPRLDHQGSTGSVTLNDPANGDIVIERDTW